MFFGEPKPPQTPLSRIFWPQHLLNLVPQLIGCERLMQKAGQIVPGEAAGRARLGIAAAQNNARVGPDPPQLVEHLLAAHMRHGEIQQYTADRMDVSLEEVDA